MPSAIVPTMETARELFIQLLNTISSLKQKIVCKTILSIKCCSTFNFIIEEVISTKEKNWEFKTKKTQFKLITK